MPKNWFVKDLPERYQQQAAEQLQPRALSGRSARMLEPESTGILKSIKAKRTRKTEEADLQTEIIEHLQTLGYLVAHFRPAKTAKGWRTPVEGDGEGFPDIIAVHPQAGRCVVLELKSSSGRVSDAQLEWLRAFQGVSSTTVTVVRPESWSDLRALL